MHDEISLMSILEVCTSILSAPSRLAQQQETGRQVVIDFAASLSYQNRQKVMKHTVEVMISEAEIAERIAELGQQITEQYRGSGSDMVLVGLLRGSFMFMADLCRKIEVSHEVDFMTASSYGSGMSTTRDVKILKDLDEDIRGKDVLIVEDIIDSGNTLSKVREILSLRQPKSLAICTLLDKPERREVEVAVEYVGFTIPDEFVVGYGIDYAQRYRHLPYVGKVVMLDE